MKPLETKQQGELRNKTKPKATRGVAEGARQEDQERQGKLQMIPKSKKAARRAANVQREKQLLAVLRTQSQKAKQEGNSKGGKAARQAAKPLENKQPSELEKTAKPKATRKVAEEARQEDQEQQGELQITKIKGKVARQAADPNDKKQQRALKRRRQAKT